MSNPGPVAFPLLKLGLAGHGPGNKWFADGRKTHHVHDARRSDDASLDVSPRFPSTGPQTFAANIAFVGFGGSCLGDQHVRKIGIRESKFQSLTIAPSRRATKPESFTFLCARWTKSISDFYI